MSESFYNQDEELLFSFINKNQVERESKALGYNNYQIKKNADRIYVLSRRKYAIEFLRLSEEKISEFSSQDIVNLLIALTSAGYSVVEDDDLEYWFQVLENEVTHRISNYILLTDFEESSDAKMLKTNSKKKYIKKTIEFSNDEVKCLLEMLISMKHILQHKEFSDESHKEKRRTEEKFKYAEMVEKILKKELQMRKEEATRKKTLKEQEFEKKKIVKLKGKTK
ncbi:MAG: hypothetical protein PHE89_07155 [Alphaproteobacteria bacterium]|nr:hypothetical protein [Alphaproteobacteria bacterium]